MTTAYIYPGLNGLLRRADRMRFLPLPEVQSRLREAEQVLRDECDLKVDLDDLLAKSAEEIYAIKNISLAAVAICAIQSGVSDRLRKVAPTPAWVMGCSLGDLARAVFAGAYEFRQAVRNHVNFTKDIDGIDKVGKNIGVAAPRDQPFTADDYAWFEEIAVDVSHLTPRFLNIGGRFRELELIEVRAKEKGWRTMTILDYPAHSRYILPFVEKVRINVLEVQTKAPTIPIFSSFSLKPLSDPEEISREFILSITQTL
ncbi:MAG: acyltransferase domain-containing protein, partial [Cryobacterium sp.]|nr:acyltransferase domain-containing protein [Oligoflexia bacterium]